MICNFKHGVSTRYTLFLLPILKDIPVAENLIQSAKAPKLPENYLSILPASYYATHTYVPPIKNLYPRPYLK